MGLADAIAAQIQKPGTKCTVGLLIETMTPEDVEALNAALDNRKVSDAAVLRALAAEGHEITKSPLERHRKRECACGPR